jgi:dolichyl-phosphate beta-glucosyltransferase
MEFSLVVPCFNESERFSAEAFANALLEQPQLHFCFVNDGSKDATEAVLQAFCARFPARTELISLPQNAGKAEALRQGLLRTIEQGHAFVGYWDADLATPLNAAPAFYTLLLSNDHIDIVMGSRVRLLGRNIARTPYRHYLGRLFATLASLALNLPVYDTQCGAKLMRNSRWLKLALDEPLGSRWCFDIVLIARYLLDCVEHGNDPEIFELPLDTWIDVKGSKLTLWDGARAFMSLAKIAMQYRRKRRQIEKRKQTKDKKAASTVQCLGMHGPKNV